MSCDYDVRTRAIEDCVKVIEDIGDQKFVDWQPGNGTRYALLFLRVDPRVKKDESNDWQITWLTKRKTMFVSDQSHVHFSYVQEKLDAGISDAICLAEAIGHILGLSSTTCEDFDPDLPVRLIMDS
jgi:hypothetical protein